MDGLIVTTQFKYRIGDVVAHLGAVHPNPIGRLRACPQRLVIMGRIVEQCPGGIQRHYRVRAVSSGVMESAFTKDLFTLHEEELVPYPEPAQGESK